MSIIPFPDGSLWRVVDLPGEDPDSAANFALIATLIHQSIDAYKEIKCQD